MFLSALYAWSLQRVLCLHHVHTGCAGNAFSQAGRHQNLDHAHYADNLKNLISLNAHLNLPIEWMLRTGRSRLKFSKLLDCLEQIRSSGSGEKSIVFSWWNSFLDLLEIPLKRRKFGLLRFDGTLPQNRREKVLKEFSESKEKKVMLMSLKAGGVGLNLSAASNVFLMDPWRNPAVEEQAIMRIHHIGQKLTVHIRRLIVKDTVEHRLQQVQARKGAMMAGTLTDEEIRSARLEELKMFFASLMSPHIPSSCQLDCK